MKRRGNLKSRTPSPSNLREGRGEGDDARDCLACQRIDQIRSRRNPNVIAELSESFVVLEDSQAHIGWCVLLLKDHHEHLAALSTERQKRLWAEVAAIARAMTHALSPARINYECLGNQLHHIHWHVIPRYANDPHPTAPIWNHLPASPKTFPAAKRKALIAKLRRAMDA